MRKLGIGISTEEEILKCLFLTTLKTIEMLSEPKRAWVYGQVALDFHLAGTLGQLSAALLKPELADPKGEDTGGHSLRKIPLQGFFEEHSIVKEITVDNSVSISVRQCLEKM